MKRIRYVTVGHLNEYNPETESVEQKQIFVDMEKPYSEANEEIAKREACNGEYAIEEDGESEAAAEATADEVLNALLGVTV